MRHGTAGRRHLARPAGTTPEVRAASSCARTRSSATGSRRTARRRPAGARGFKAEPGRYHLYVSLACPWAHRTLIFRKLKRLEDMISVSVVHWLMGEDGWTFSPRRRRAPATRSTALDFLHQIYTQAQTRLYRPRHRAGALGQAASRRSSPTNRPKSSACSTRPSTHVATHSVDFYPEALRGEIDAVNARVYPRDQQRRLPGRLRDHAGGL